MYKTVRHGESSLQYTILAQDDNGPMKRRRSNRRNTAFILIVTLILGCGIVAAAVLIPVLLTSNVVTLPARFQTFAVAATNVKGKYNIQGTQYIALLPVKDATGHFNAFQLRPTTTTTTTPAATIVTLADIIRTANSSTNVDSVTSTDKPRNISEVTVLSPRVLRKEFTTTSLWLDTHIILSIGVCTTVAILIIAVFLLIRRYTRIRSTISETTPEFTDSDKGTLLAEISGEED